MHTTHDTRHTTHTRRVECRVACSTLRSYKPLQRQGKRIYIEQPPPRPPSCHRNCMHVLSVRMWGVTRRPSKSTSRLIDRTPHQSVAAAAAAFDISIGADLNVLWRRAQQQRQQQMLRNLDKFATQSVKPAIKPRTRSARAPRHRITLSTVWQSANRPTCPRQIYN